VNTFWVGVFVAVVFYETKDVLRVWREEKAKVQEVRRQYGVPLETRWWRL